MTESGEDLRSLLPLLEHPRQESSIDDDVAARLVAFGVTAWSDWWASKALDWVDQGVWSDGVAEALRRCARDKRYSQETRHRAWRYVKPGEHAMADNPTSDQPSRRLVEQRVRNRVIEYLELAASFEDQREYERNAPIAHIPHEIIEQWRDWVPVDPATDDEALNVYTPDEVEALSRFEDAWTRAAAGISNDYPSLAQVQGLPRWAELRQAAASALAVLAKRGRLPEDYEVT